MSPAAPAFERPHKKAKRLAQELEQARAVGRQALAVAGKLTLELARAEGQGETLRQAIAHALEAADGLEWLRAWNEGDADATAALDAAPLVAGQDALF